MGFIDDLADLFSDVLVVHPGTTDEFGDFIASGSTASYPCHFELSERLTRTVGGREITSSMSAIVAGYNNLSTKDHRYTIPSRYSPDTSIAAIAVIKETDEDGPCYEEVLFP